MSVSRRGDVLRINGLTESDDGEWDALLRLPVAPLDVGLEWSDTLSHPTDVPHGQGIYEIHRNYRVARELATPDGVRLEIEIEGRLAFALSMWMDSAAGHYRWFDLEGPVEERFVFDPVSGQLHERSWSMLLEGVGGDYDGMTSDTVAAGLRSANTRYRIPAARAAALMATLPGADSSVTFTGDGDIQLLHVLDHEPTRLTESVKSRDGMVTTAVVVLSDGQPRRWTFTRVDPGTDVRTEVFEADANDLIADGDRHVPPTPAWGVAEREMVGTLIPSLNMLEAPQALPFSIYRPSELLWERVSVTSRPFPEFIIHLLMNESGAQTAVLVNADGVVLYAETTNPGGNRVIRVPASEGRQAELQRFLALLQGGN